MKYIVKVEFEYDSEEGAPLTGKPLNSADDAIQAVRDELEEFSPYQLTIECESFDEEWNSLGIRKG
jgi:hypothetical protein